MISFDITTQAVLWSY